MAGNETIRRRPASSQVRETKEEEEPTSYEPPDGVPAGTIFFRFNKFQHNSKIALFTVPSACLLAMFGGQTTVGIVVAGILMIYLLDFYGWKESTFVTIWVTVSTVAVTLITSSVHLFTISMFNIALVYNMLIFACGIGIWATLQFSFLQQQNQRMILLFERLLFAIMPSSPPVIMTWAAIATYGMESAPYFLLAFLTTGYWLYVMPTRSSFRVLGKGRSKSLTTEMDELDELVMGRFESAVHNVSFMMLPVFLKYAIHHTHLVSSMEDIADLMLLVSFPLLVIAASSSRGSLWWLGFSATIISAVRKTLVTAAVLIIVGSLEIRVVFHSFSQYIKIQPPWDVVTVTCGVYLIAMIALAHFGGLLESERMTMPLTLVGGAALSCLCLALGVPAYMASFGCAGAFFCARFYYHKRLQDYCSFVGAATLVIFWFVIRTFMFLDFEFDPLPMSLRHVCLVLMGVVLTSLLIPGLVSVNKVEWINGAVLCLHAAGVSVIELQLHCQFEGIYPAYLVLFTSAGGLYLADHLFSRGKVGSRWAWLMGSLYAGKLGLLLHPTPLALPSALIVVLAVSPIYVGVVVLRQRSQQSAVPAPAEKLSRKSATGLLLAVAAALMATRHTVLTALMRATIHRAPPESFLLGTVCIVWTVACSGVFVHHFPQSARLRRSFAILLCAGAALILVQPDMEFARQWSLVRSETPPGMLRGTQTPRWPAWCLFGAALAGLLLVGSSNSARRLWASQATLSAVGGLLAGLYFEGTFLPYSPGLFALAAAACALAAQLVTLVPLAATHGSSYLQLAFTCFVGLLPVAVMLQPILLRSAVAAHLREDALQAHRVGLIGLYIALCVVVAAAAKMQSPDRDANQSTVAGPALAPRPKAELVRPRAALAAAAAAARGLSADWLPAAGNLATLIAYGLALTLSKGYLGGSDEVVVALAPLLLLLQRDSGLFASLTDRQRYFPMVAASVVCLASMAIFRLLLREPLEHRRIIARSPQPHIETAGLVAVVKNLGLLAVSLPGHAMFCRFLWDLRQTKDLYWVLLLPLNVLPLALADLRSVRLLALLALAEGSLQLFISSRIRRFGLQFV